MCSYSGAAFDGRQRWPSTFRPKFVPRFPRRLKRSCLETDVRQLGRAAVIEVPLLSLSFVCRLEHLHGVDLIRTAWPTSNLLLADPRLRRKISRTPSLWEAYVFVVYVEAIHACGCDRVLCPAHARPGTTPHSSECPAY